MTENSINLCSESYKFSMNKGFSVLQQQQEFVDVTIAVDGCLVKAHQNILALASPYIKALLQSAPCQHPIIFLSGIAHKVLAHILEYIYTGEVQIPCELYPSFIQAAKHMHIVGLDEYSVLDPKTLHYEDTNCLDEVVEAVPDKNMSQKRTDCSEEVSDNVEYDNRNTKRVYVDGSTNNTNEYDLGSMADKNIIIDLRDTFYCETNNVPVLQTESESFALGSNREVDTELEDFTIQKVSIHTDSQMPCANLNVEESGEQEVLEDHKTGPLYTVSIRGSLMMILNRFLYNMHHQSANGSKRRWRCIDYRRKHCLAYVDTQDEVVTGR
ncbi:unnamed protein product [Diatraea saccharalis]|uniref:BTB domain-containing protein n=1 Tax=Diatraea saccharalis TaxID=40085 RepID=A0A9N9QXZ0_9NEOP|nr:unnamed protein product [Diatraea saccharalis]